MQAAGPARERAGLPPVRLLSRSVRAAGLLRRRPGYYSIKIAVNLLLLAAGWAAFFLLGRS